MTPEVVPMAPADTAWMLVATALVLLMTCLLYTSPSPRD